MRGRAIFLLLSVLLSSAIGYIAAAVVGSGSSAIRSASTGPVVLRPAAIGTVRFGTSESIATSTLTALLGQSEGPAQRQDEGGCGTYNLLSWSTIEVFFMHGQLVGYNTGYTPSKKISTFETAQGLRIGDTIADAQRIYGPAFRTSSAQGGSWAVTTAGGSLIGLLSDAPMLTGSSDHVAGIAAGYVGCPAMTP